MNEWKKNPVKGKEENEEKRKEELINRINKK